MALRYEDLPAAVVDRAKGLTLQNLASALLGSQMAAGQQATKFVIDEEAGVSNGATVLVVATKVTKGGAGFANSEMTLAGGKWDTFRMLTHPGTAIIPSALIAAESEGATGWKRPRRPRDGGGRLARSEAVKVEDWSWQRTVRRVTTLDLLAAPYKRQTTLAIVSLLAAAATALARLLAGLAIDDGIAKPTFPQADDHRPALLIAGVLNLETAQRDVLHRLDGRADPGRPRRHALPPPATSLPRLLRAQPRGRDHQPITNDVEALDQLVTDGVTPLVQSRSSWSGPRSSSSSSTGGSRSRRSS